MVEGYIYVLRVAYGVRLRIGSGTFAGGSYFVGVSCLGGVFLVLLGGRLVGVQYLAYKFPVPSQDGAIL